jgi:hypothetical protein
MAFDFGRLFRSIGVVLASLRHFRRRWSLKKVLFLLGFVILVPLLELFTWLGFLLDEILYPGLRRVQVEAPVFIVGNPRSGTTFLFRLMAKDVGNFRSMRLWEMIFAPSVVYRRLVWAILRVSTRLGRPVRRLLAWLEGGWQEKDVIHRATLRMREEDLHLLLHIWSTPDIWLYSGMLDEAQADIYFDQAMPERDKRRILTFYERCIQRHLYARNGEGQHYLAKNPAYTPRIDALWQQFPEARIIYLARNPLDMIPSYMSMLTFTWETIGDPAGADHCRDFVLDMAYHWYTYPLERLAQAPEDKYIVVNFEDLVGDPEGTVTRIYQRLGLVVHDAYAQILREEALKAEDYNSQHEYSLEEMGLTQAQILEKFGEVFECFGFDRREP